MTDEEIREKIFDIVARDTRTDRHSLTLETPLTDLTTESLHMVEILFDVEEALGVYVPEYDESFKLATLGDVVDGVKKLMAAKPQA